MRAVTSNMELIEPRSLHHALDLMREESIVPLAGCTDVFVSLNSGSRPGTRYLDLGGLAALRGISERGKTLTLGALTTFSEMAASALVRRRLPMLVAAAREIGSVQIQNRGTIGGNIANASPAGDSLPVLAAAEAIVVLRSAEGTRRVPFTAFYTGYRQSVRRPDELIVAVEIPKVEGRQWFRKVGTRAAQAISKIAMAAVRAPHPRIALASVAPTVVRAYRAEAALAGGASIADARRELMADIAPIDDVRSTAQYRRRVAQNLLEAFWTETT